MAEAGKGGKINEWFREDSFFRLDRGGGKVGSVSLILLAETTDAQEGHKLNILNIQAVEVIVATGGSRISLANA